MTPDEAVKAWTDEVAALRQRYGAEAVHMARTIRPDLSDGLTDQDLCNDRVVELWVVARICNPRGDGFWEARLITALCLGVEVRYELTHVQVHVQPLRDRVEPEPFRVLQWT